MSDLGGTAAGYRNTVRVLHVDAVDFTEITAGFLTQLNEAFIVDTAADATAGLALLESTRYDCIVSDYDMPEMNGIEFLEAVRERDQDVPFILFTGKGSEEVASEAISAGVTDYLQKQSGTEQYELLANRIGNLVEAARSTEQLAERTRRLETLISNLPGMVYRCRNEPSWPEELVEGEVETLSGYTAEELETGTVTWGDEVVHPDDQEFLWESVQEGLSPSDSFEFTYRIITRDGTVKWVWERGRGVYVDGELTALEGFITDVTDRKKWETRIEQTNTLLSTLFETLPFGVVIEDAERNVRSVNARLLELFDLSGEPADAVGRDGVAMAREMADALDRPDAFAARIERLDDTTEPLRDEEIRFTDGRTLAQSHRPLDLPDGRGHLWLYRDITDRTERERTLRQHEAFLQNSPDAFYVIDDAGVVTYQSHGPEELAGAPRRDLQGRSATQYIYPDDRDAVVADFEYLLAHPGETRTSEYRFESPSGEWRWYENRAVNKLDDPTIEGIIVVNRDITARKTRELKLRRFQSRLEALIRGSTRAAVAEVAVEAAHDVFDLRLSGVHLVNDEGTALEPVAVTDEVAEFFDDPPRYDRVDPSRPTDTDNWTFFEAGDCVVIEDTHEDERIDASATPTRSGIIHPLGDHGLFITSSPEPRAFDESDVSLIEILATVVTAALDQVEQAQTLRERSQRLEAETERLDEFASIVSHDLRTPLSVATGRLQLARETGDDTHLDAAEQANDQMETLIDDLLSLAREGADAMGSSALALSAVATRVSQGLSADEATVHVETDLRVEADRTRLDQLLSNLVRNAVEHGGPDVTVTVGDLEDESGFYVADDGPGIPPELRERVFESGYSSAEDGTGFGLRIVTQVAEAHGWTVVLTESATGGARFEVRDVTLASE